MERKCITMKINLVKVANITGVALSIGATLLGAWSGQKSTEETIAKKVAEALANQAKEQ
jgi:hypothetical protein